nr:MAG TPA: hypothetical protein [Microviridae sp.]
MSKLSDPLLLLQATLPLVKGGILTVIFDFILNILKGVVVKCLRFIQSWMIRHSVLIRRTLPKMTWLLAVLLVICVTIVGALLVSISAISTCIV